MQAQDGATPAQALTGNSRARYSSPRWSADDKRIALADQTGRLYVIEVASKAELPSCQGSRRSDPDYQWSPDGQYLGYTLNGANGYSGVYIWSAADGKSRRVTPELFNAQSPAWSPDGALLYFLSAREYQPIISPIEFNFATDRQTGIFAIALRSDVKNPYGVRDDEPGDGSKDSDNDKGKGKEQKGTSRPPYRIRRHPRANHPGARGGRQPDRFARDRREFDLPARRAFLLRA